MYEHRYHIHILTRTHTYAHIRMIIALLVYSSLLAIRDIPMLCHLSLSARSLYCCETFSPPIVTLNTWFVTLLRPPLNKTCRQPAGNQGAKPRDWHHFSSINESRHFGWMPYTLSSPSTMLLQGPSLGPLHSHTHNEHRVLDCYGNLSRMDGNERRSNNITKSFISREMSTNLPTQIKPC